jgi:hypothetical protein
MGDESIQRGEALPESGKPSGLLYHYTDQKGLLGILESKGIWATHVRHLNDGSEFTLGWDKSWETLLHLISLSEFQYKDQLERIYTRFRKVISSSPEHTNYYVWCLTEDSRTDSDPRGFQGDRLSQWRAYSGGGHGFSLGFDSTILEGCFSTSMKVVYSLGRCLYDEKMQNSQIKDLAARHLQEFLDKWSVYFHQLRDPKLGSFENFKNNLDFTVAPIVNMYADFVQLGAFMKHPGFVEENEWRFVFVSEHGGDCSFRESRFGLTPYLPIGLDFCRSPSPLKRIIVGPGPHKEEWVETVRLLLAKRLSLVSRWSSLRSPTATGDPATAVS